MATGVGNRFDLEAAREEARLKKQREMINKIVSWVTLVIAVGAVAIGAMWGWDKWQEKKAAEAEAERERQAEIERQEAKAKKEKEAKREAERQKREAKALADRIEREKKMREKEEAKLRAQAERERQRIEKEEAKRKEEEDRLEQQELKRYAEDMLSTVRFVLDEHVEIEMEFKDCLELACQDTEWRELVAVGLGKNARLFVDLLGPKEESEKLTAGRYPSRDAMMAARKKLDAERFTMAITLRKDSRFGGVPVLCELDPEKGLRYPDNAQEVMDGRRVIGWTVPFVYGARNSLFVLNKKTAAAFRREWNGKMKSVEEQRKKLNLQQDWVDERKAQIRAEFVKKMQVQLNTPPPEPVEEEKPVEKPKPKKSNQTMKGPANGGGNVDRVRRL